MTTIESDLAPPEDDDTFQLLAIRRRRKLPLVTATLVVALVAAGAFIGGVEIQKHQGGSSVGSFRGALTSGLAGQGAGTTTGRTGTTGSTRGGGFGGVGGAGGGTTFGTVTVIKGSTLYVTDANGNTVKVTTSASSRVTKTTTATITLGGVQPGDTVVVRGTQQKSGNIAADTITLGAGGFGGGASGFGSGSSGGASGFGRGSSGGASGVGSGSSGSGG